LRAVCLPSFSEDSPGYWHGRLWAELEFAHSVSRLEGGQWDTLISETLDHCLAVLSSGVTEETARVVEDRLLLMHAAAKANNVICAANAHIDMNWMWSFDETVAVMVDTFRTMLDLLAEYLDFKFSQSQASVYKRFCFSGIQ